MPMATKLGAGVLCGILLEVLFRQRKGRIGMVRHRGAAGQASRQEWAGQGPWESASYRWGRQRALP